MKKKLKNLMEELNLTNETMDYLQEYGIHGKKAIDFLNHCKKEGLHGEEVLDRIHGWY